MNDIRDIIREREAAELAGAAKRRQSWLALQREGEVGSEWRESVITLMQYPGAIGTILGIIGFAFGLIPLWVTFGPSAAVGAPGLGFVLILLLVPFVTISCVAVGLPLSGAAFYQARKFGTPIGIPIAGWMINAIALVPISGTFLYLMWLSSWES